MRPSVALWLAFLPLALAAQGVRDVSVSAKERTGIELTLYHGDLAMIRETRKIELPEGPVRLALLDVAASIRPNTVLLDLGDSARDITFLERSFEFNLLSPASLTDASYGSPATTRDAEGRLAPWAELASLPLRKRVWSPRRTPLQRLARIGPVLRDPDLEVLLKREQGFEPVPSAGLVLRELPSQLQPRPVLKAELQSPSARTTELRMAYLARGLEWQASYVARLSPSARTLDLDAWVTLQNRSGTDFENAAMQLVAGDPNQVWERPILPSEEQVVDKTTTTVEVCATAPSFREERISEFHLLTLDQPTTIRNRQEKQLHLFSAERIPASRTCYFLMQPVTDWYSHPTARKITPMAWIEGSEDLWQWGLRTQRRPGEDDETLLSRVNTLRYPAKLPDQTPRIQSPGLLLTFRNDKASGLGRPLPKGKVSVRAQLQGIAEIPMEDLHLDAAAIGETCTLEIPPYDTHIAGVTGRHRWRPLLWTPRELPPEEKRANHDDLWLELEGEAILANTRREAMPTLVRLDLGAGFELLSTSVPVERRDASTLDLAISLPPRSRKVLKYRARLPVSFPPLPKE